MSKQTKQFETIIRAAFVAVILLTAYKCTAQDFRINTAVGLIAFTESANPDEICFSFGVLTGEIRAEHLSKAAETLPGKVAAAVRMADDAGVKYPVFLRENQISDSPAVYEYYKKCRAIRNQIFSLMPERAFVELRHQTQYFK